MGAQLKIVMLAVAGAMLLTPVASAGEAKTTIFKGEVVGIEPIFESGPSNVELTVKILDASRWGRDAEGRVLTFVADDETRVRVGDRDGSGEGELSDVQPGIRVVVQGAGARFDGEWYVAQVTHVYRSPSRD